MEKLHQSAFNVVRSENGLNFQMIDDSSDAKVHTNKPLQKLKCMHIYTCFFAFY